MDVRYNCTGTGKGVIACNSTTWVDIGGQRKVCMSHKAVVNMLNYLSYGTAAEFFKQLQPVS